LNRTRRARVDQREEFLSGAFEPLPERPPDRPFRCRALAERQAVPLDLRPHQRLRPVHPRAAEFEFAAQPFGGPGAAPDAVTGFKHEHGRAPETEFPCRGQAGESGTDHDHIETSVHFLPLSSVDRHAPPSDHACTKNLRNGSWKCHTERTPFGKCAAWPGWRRTSSPSSVVIRTSPSRMYIVSGSRNSYGTVSGSCPGSTRQIPDTPSVIQWTSPACSAPSPKGT